MHIIEESKRSRQDNDGTKGVTQAGLSQTDREQKSRLVLSPQQTSSAKPIGTDPITFYGTETHEEVVMKESNLSPDPPKIISIEDVDSQAAMLDIRGRLAGVFYKQRRGNADEDSQVLEKLYKEEALNGKKDSDISSLKEASRLSPDVVASTFRMYSGCKESPQVDVTSGIGQHGFSTSGLARQKSDHTLFELSETQKSASNLTKVVEEFRLTDFLSVGLSRKKPSTNLARMHSFQPHHQSKDNKEELLSNNGPTSLKVSPDVFYHRKRMGKIGSDNQESEAAVSEETTRQLEASRDLMPTPSVFEIAETKLRLTKTAPEAVSAMQNRASQETPSQGVVPTQASVDYQLPIECNTPDLVAATNLRTSNEQVLKAPLRSKGLQQDKSIERGLGYRSQAREVTETSDSDCNYVPTTSMADEEEADDIDIKTDQECQTANSLLDFCDDTDDKLHPLSGARLSTVRAVTINSQQAQQTSEADDYCPALAKIVLANTSDVAHPNPSSAQTFGNRRSSMLLASSTPELNDNRFATRALGGHGAPVKRANMDESNKIYIFDGKSSQGSFSEASSGHKTADSASYSYQATLLTNDISHSQAHKMVSFNEARKSDTPSQIKTNSHINAASGNDSTSCAPFDWTLTKTLSLRGEGVSGSQSSSQTQQEDEELIMDVADELNICVNDQSQAPQSSMGQHLVSSPNDASSIVDREQVQAIASRAASMNTDAPQDADDEGSSCNQGAAITTHTIKHAPLMSLEEIRGTVTSVGRLISEIADGQPYETVTSADESFSDSDEPKFRPLTSGTNSSQDDLMVCKRQSHQDLNLVGSLRQLANHDASHSLTEQDFLAVHNDEENSAGGSSCDSPSHQLSPAILLEIEANEQQEEAMAVHQPAQLLSCEEKKRQILEKFGSAVDVINEEDEQAVTLSEVSSRLQSPLAVVSNETHWCASNIHSVQSSHDARRLTKQSTEHAALLLTSSSDECCSSDFSNRQRAQQVKGSLQKPKWLSEKSQNERDLKIQPSLLALQELSMSNAGDSSASTKASNSNQTFTKATTALKSQQSLKRRSEKPAGSKVHQYQARQPPAGLKTTSSPITKALYQKSGLTPTAKIIKPSKSLKITSITDDRLSKESLESTSSTSQESSALQKPQVSGGSWSTAATVKSAGQPTRSTPSSETPPAKTMDPSSNLTGIVPYKTVVATGASNMSNFSVAKSKTPCFLKTSKSKLLPYSSTKSLLTKPGPLTNTGAVLSPPLAKSASQPGGKLPTLSKKGFNSVTPHSKGSVLILSSTLASDYKAAKRTPTLHSSFLSKQGPSGASQGAASTTGVMATSRNSYGQGSHAQAKGFATTLHNRYSTGSAGGGFKNSSFSKAAAAQGSSLQRTFDGPSKQLSLSPVRKSHSLLIPTEASMAITSPTSNQSATNDSTPILSKFKKKASERASPGSRKTIVPFFKESSKVMVISKTTASLPTLPKTKFQRHASAALRRPRDHNHIQVSTNLSQTLHELSTPRAFDLGSRLDETGTKSATCHSLETTKQKPSPSTLSIKYSYSSERQSIPSKKLQLLQSELLRSFGGGRTSGKPFLAKSSSTGRPLSAFTAASAASTFRKQGGTPSHKKENANPLATSTSQLKKKGPNVASFHKRDVNTMSTGAASQGPANGVRKMPKAGRRLVSQTKSQSLE